MGWAAMASAQTQLYTSDIQQAQTIGVQMQADGKKQMMRRWQIQQDTQTKMNEITQDVNVHKSKTMDKMFQKWDAYMRS